MDANHLTSDEIQLVAELRSCEQVDGNIAIPERVRQHADSCETCARRVSMQIDFRRRLALLKSPGSSLKSSDCPNPDTVWQLAFAEPQSGQAKAILEHVANCDHCGGLLQRAVEEFDQELSPKQQDLLHAVQTSRISSHPRMANELASIVERSGQESTTVRKAVQTRRFRRWVFAFSVATVLLVVALLGSLTIRRSRPAYAGSLIAQAYTAARPFEPRFRGAAFAPIRIERGGRRSETERPPALLDAEALIGRKLSRSPDDPAWLDVRGRADLLDGHYGSAIQAFERALVVEPGSAQLEVDLATALFQRAQAENNAADLAEAADHLSRVIQKGPKDSIALFNRGIVLEHMFLFDQALDDWQQYLKIDATGEWADEARKHVADIQRKLQDKGTQDRKSLLAPTELAAENLNPDPKQLQDVDLRIEQYLAFALRQWPADLFTHPTSHPTGSNRDGLQNIARILRGNHEDSWLMRFLSAESASHSGGGFGALRNAILSSDHADYNAALRYADQAKGLFQVEGNVPGVLRARFEHIYALQFSNHGLDCSLEAQLLATAAREEGYLWIEQQSMIEEGICLNLLGEFGPASQILESAITAASHTRYAVTRVRATVMLGLVLWDSGKSRLAWGRLREAAQDCWNEYCPETSLYSIYANMDNFSEDSRLWYVQVFAAQQAVVTAESDPDFLMRAVEHTRLASAAALAGFPELARENFEVASHLLNKAPPSEVTANYQAGINIDLAKLAFAQGNSQAASQYLKLAENRIPDMDDYYLLTDFFLTKARIGVNRPSVVQDNSSLQWAVALAERQLTSLPSRKDRFTWSQKNGAIYRELVETDLQKGDLRGALAKWEWFLAAPGRIRSGLNSPSPPPQAADVFVLNRSYAAPPPLPPLVTTEEIVQRLQGQTMLSYVLLSNRLGAWVLNDKGLDFRWLTTDADRLFRLSRNFVELCSSPSADRSSWENHATALYDVLISPLEDHLTPGRQLLIDGEPGILSVPFSALVDRRGRRLLEKFPVSIIPGSYLLPSNPAKDTVNFADRTLIVDSAASDDKQLNLHPLSPSLTESTVIAAKFRSPHVLRGSEVQLSILKREIPQALVFHYTGHSSSDERFVGILVSDDQSPRPRAIFDSSVIRAFGPIRTQLVVLSACATVGGKRGDFADEDSLTYAFLEGAVPHVIASRWNVDSVVTARLMDKFYSNLLAGQPIAEALRLAELEISASPDTDRPYFWAAFGAYGTS